MKIKTISRLTPALIFLLAFVWNVPSFADQTKKSRIRSKLASHSNSEQKPDQSEEHDNSEEESDFERRERAKRKKRQDLRRYQPELEVDPD